MSKHSKRQAFTTASSTCCSSSDKETAGERLRQQLGAPGHAEVEEALKQAAKTLGRLPIVVLEVPRQVSEMKVLASCSGLAKTLCYDKELAKLIVLASSASMALSFDADAREVRLQIASLSEEECQQEKAGRPFAESVPLFGMLPDQVQEFLKHHGGDAAVEHKADLLQLTGGNVGKLEALGVKRGACALLCRAFPASQELAKNLKIQTFEQVRQEAMGQQDGFVLCLFFCVFFAICQVMQIKRFLGIDMQGGFGPERGPSCQGGGPPCSGLSISPVRQGRGLRDRFTSKHLAQAVKAQGAHCIYVKATTKADERFCAASPSVHALLKQMAPALANIF